jgi:hypothetical protein
MAIYEMEVNDINGNYKHHVIKMRNWIDYTNESMFSIPRSSVLIVCTPTDSIIRLYEQNKMDEDEELEVITEPDPSDNDNSGKGSTGSFRPSRDGWPWFKT